MLILLQDNTICWFSIQKLNSDDLKSYNVSYHWYDAIKEFRFDPKNREITVDHHHLEFQRSAINHNVHVTVSCWAFYLLFFCSNGQYECYCRYCCLLLLGLRFYIPNLDCFLLNKSTRLDYCHRISVILILFLFAEIQLYYTVVTIVLFIL